ncbi:MAG TPA: hypothetical protein VGQ38_03590 [Gaiellaceae bacterium]|jgi:hypothetical protein|nr:hypothetical protein [Gaiellaceae bacterium]
MGLKDLFKRWSKAEDERAIERAEEDSRGTAFERDLEQEDFEGRKQDTWTADHTPEDELL